MMRDKTKPQVELAEAQRSQMGFPWIKKLYLTFHQHEDESIMTEFSFLGELSL